MGYFERRFVRPSFHDLVTALDEATHAANEEQALLEFDHVYWTAFVSDIRTRPEGVEQWCRNLEPVGPAGVVGVAWWTDSLDRRHFRVWAGSSVDDSFTGQLLPERELGPPAWA